MSQIVYICLYLPESQTLSVSLPVAASESVATARRPQTIASGQLLARAQRADLHCLAEHINYYFTVLRMS